MKIYDFDGMFDEKLSAYVSKNANKYTEGEWEDVIPQLYDKFGDTEIKSIGKSPRKFYADMADGELIRCLKTHLKQGVPVCGFLNDEIEKRNLTDFLIPLLDGDDNERGFAMNLIGADDKVIKKYLEMLVNCDDEETRNRCADFIKEKADLVLPEVVNYYEKGVCPEYMLEIMSRSVIKDERVLNILLKEFRGSADNLPMYASYLAAYGDERALPYLLDKIDEEGIGFLEFQELKFAVESLGGEYKKERDFSSDPLYILIHPEN